MKALASYTWSLKVWLKLQLDEELLVSAVFCLLCLRRAKDEWLENKIEDGNEVFFRIKRSTQLKKLMNAYCDRQSVDIKSIAFLFDGRRLNAEQTPDQLEMEDGDEIDAMLHQTGGSLPA